MARQPARRRESAPEDRIPLIPSWLRVLTVLVVLIPWSVGVMFSMVVLKQLPDVAWMAVPSSVIVAVAPAWSLPKRLRAAAPDDGHGEREEPSPPPRRRPAPPPDDEWTRWGS